MWKKSVSKTFTNVSKEQIWKVWTDINNWASWHDDLDYCKMEGTFKVGNFFLLKPKKMRPVKIFLTDIKEGKSFTDCTSFIGAKMYDTHELEETAEGLKLSNTVVVTGPLRWLWVKLVAQHVAESAENELDAAVSLARKKIG